MKATMQPAFSGFGRNGEMNSVTKDEPGQQLGPRRTTQSDFLPADSMEEARPMPIRMNITPKWEDMTELTRYTAAKHQTLFAMDSSGQAIIGTPPNPDEIRRVCGSITSYMKPRFLIQLFDSSGQPLKRAVRTVTTIVNANTGKSDEGTCDHCKQVAPSKRPIVYQWRSGRNKLFSEIQGETDEEGKQVLDIKIGCLTGTGLSRQQKGHKYDFMIRTELPDYPGVVGYSVAIQMGSKYIDCSQKHSKKKEVELSRMKKATGRRPAPLTESSGSLLPMQVSPTSATSVSFPNFGEIQPAAQQKHGIVLPPIASVVAPTEMVKKPFFREENRYSAPVLAFPGRETPAWNRPSQSRKEPRAVERSGQALLPPIKALPQFDHAADSFHRQPLPPVHKSGVGEPIIPPLEVILSSISQDHGDSHRKSPMLQLAESFMEAANTMEQCLTEQGLDSHSPHVERHLSKRPKQERSPSDHSIRSYSMVFDSNPLSPMSECSPSIPNFDSHAPVVPSVEAVLGCSANALTLEERAEVWQFLCGNLTNPGKKPLRYVVLNHEPPFWAPKTSGTTVEQTILELNYETGRWSIYKQQGQYH